AFRGAAVAVAAKASPHCGENGRVCRVFWRANVPWVLMRSTRGIMLSIPWSVTNLPLPVPTDGSRPKEHDVALLSPDALVALARFVQDRPPSPSTAAASLRRA